MSYRNGRGCCDGSRGGLGQAESPQALVSQYARLHAGFQSTLQKLPSGNVSLANQAISIQRWFTEAAADLGRGDLRNARIKLNTLERTVPAFGWQVGEAIAGGKKALEEATAGASPLRQVLATLGFGDGIYQPESKTANAFEFGGWAVALAAGALGLTLLSSLARK